MHGCRLSISSLHLGCRESLLLSLLDHFVSLLLSALCRSALSCLASGVYMTCFKPAVGYDGSNANAADIPVFRPAADELGEYEVEDILDHRSHGRGCS